EFLAHVERTRLLVHVLDLAPLDGSDPVANHATVEHELAHHGAGLAALPRVLALSKADLVTADAAQAAAHEWRQRLGDGVLEVVVTSAATGQGLDDLRRAVLEHVPVETHDESDDAPPVAAEPEAEHRVYRPGPGDGFSVERGPDGTFRVTGTRVERLIARHDTDNEEALEYVEARLRALGVIRALEAAGFEPGDDVEIGGVVFELDPAGPA
ncbi:MAG: GTPase, partial [Thermoleophilaceae bacterium]|nr:GTPase [Thermoleophilaceae bacterium]